MMKFIKRPAALCVLVLLYLGCATGNTPCGTLTDVECNKTLARHEVFPGEFSLFPKAVRVEYRQGKKGVWIGSNIFSVEVEIENYKKNHSPSLPAGPLYTGATAVAVEKAKYEMLFLLGIVFMDELSRRPGMINYEMSHEAFNSAMRPILRGGYVVKQEQIDARCRIVFQVTARCLQSIVYAKEDKCR